MDLRLRRATKPGGRSLDFNGGGGRKVEASSHTIDAVLQYHCNYYPLTIVTQNIDRYRDDAPAARATEHDDGLCWTHDGISRSLLRLVIILVIVV